MSLALLLSRATRAEQAGPDQPPESDVEVMHVRAVRTGQLPEAPSAFATAIDVESFEGENKSVADLLEEAVGVQVRRFGGAGQESEVSIRGSNGRQVVILLDGVRINSAQSGSVDLSTIPRDLIERIEVVRGGGSVQTGGAAIGGVVNIVTKRAGGKPACALAVARSSFRTWQLSASHTGRLLGTDLALGYEFFHTKGDWRFAPLDVVIDGVSVPPTDPGPIERVNNRNKNHSGLLKLGRDVGDHLRIELSDQLFRGDAGRPGLDQDEGGALHGQSLSAHAWRTRNVADVSLRAHAFAPGQLEAVLRGFHRYERNRFEDESPPTGPMLDSDDRDRSYGGRLELSGAARLGPTRHAPFLGVDLFRDVLDSKQAGGHARRVFGFALQDEISLFARRLRVVPALRYDGTGGLDSQWLPRVGVILAPWSWLRFKGNAERAYRAPNFNELYFNEGSLRGNPALRPEQSRNFDLGAELLFDRIGPLRRASFEAVVFRNKIQNSIVFQPVSPNVVAATNVSDALARGLELSGGADLTDWLRLSGNWTRLDTEILRTGNPLPGRPAHELLLRVELGPKSGLFKLVGERRETAAIPANEGGSRLISGRTVYDASAILDLSQLLRLGERSGLHSLLVSVSGTNLGDVSVRDAQSFPQPGRVLAFRIEVRR
jgi:vitamin B12 transporter